MSADAGSLHTICRVLFWVFRFDQILVIALYFALHFDQIPSCTQYRRNLFYFQASNGFQPFFNTDQLSWRPSARTTATDKRFQSTHSLRSATPCSIPCLTSWMSFQSTHSLRSATQTEARTRTMLKVSIHALVRVRHTPRLFHNQTGRFQSTHS